MKKISKDMIIADILAIDEGVADILLNSGMRCVGCPSAQGETLEDASLVHGFEVDVLVNEINEYLAAS